MWREPSFSGCTRSFESAPPKCPGSSSQGTSAMLRIEGSRLPSLPMTSSSIAGRGLHEFLAEDRLLVRDGRQRPSTDGGRADIGVDMDVDEAGLAERHRMLERALEILGARHRHALDAAGAGECREIGVVGLVVGALVERRA